MRIPSVPIFRRQNETVNYELEVSNNSSNRSNTAIVASSNSRITAMTVSSNNSITFPQISFAKLKKPKLSQPTSRTKMLVALDVIKHGFNCTNNNSKFAI